MEPSQIDSIATVGGSLINLSYLFGLIETPVRVVVLVLAGWFGGIWVRRFIIRTALRMGWDEILWRYVGTALRYLVMIMFSTSALKAAGVDIGPMLATFGISGVIIGLGARQSISNYFFGIMMLGAKPFKRGDLIEFGPPNQIGVVRDVKMTYTALDSLDNVRLIVPNSVIWRNKITNFSVHTARAIRITMKFAYDVDVDWVRDISMHVLDAHEAVLNSPAPRFSVGNVGSEFIVAQLMAWSNVDTMTIFGDVMMQMRKEFETAGLKVTVPAGDIDLRREE